jgi:hypothetical protein
MYNFLKQVVSVLSSLWSQSVPFYLKFIFVHKSALGKHLFRMHSTTLAHCCKWCRLISSYILSYVPSGSSVLYILTSVLK